MVKKQKYNNFCCEIMEGYINNDDKATPLVEYDSSTRDYSFLIFNNPYGTHQALWYCPWCGKKLPKELNDEWDKILKEEYGITDPFDEDKDKVPKEFWTDEWWKKRGL